ncbi:MAG: DNA polymerase III subunit gamma/tau [Candidatus Paceibacterota bacterium]|jgi:DNA polymerase-3 subunit gamma/tau
MALAIYRKYRPRTFEDVLGQENITELLKNAAASNRLAHAYLFFGPRGCGKTTTARLIAKIANCETRQQDENFRKKGEPCNHCRVCKEVDEGHALDIIEIDAASNRGIDEIRNLKEGINLSPTSYQYKVFIIDEAHQLTKEAFNALLKTLEEPPAHAILILATTQIEKIPATIASRTQRFQFKKVPLLTIVEKLKKIVEQEKIEITKDALEMVAAAAEGSFRDSESLLEQLASLSEKINLENVEQTLGRVGFLKTAGLAELLVKKDMKAALEYLYEINESGYNLVQFNKDLIHYLRRVLSLKLNPQLENMFKKEITDSELEIIKKHSKIAEDQQLIKLIKSLIEAYTEMRYSPFTVVPLEVAIVENLK